MLKIEFKKLSQRKALSKNTILFSLVLTQLTSFICKFLKSVERCGAKHPK